MKIRLQLQHHVLPPASTIFSPSTIINGPKSLLPPPVNGPIYHGILPTIRTIIREEGITGLWKGNIPAELLYVTYGATQFLAFRKITRLITQSGLDVPDSAKNAIAGAAAGAASSSVTYPFDLLRTRFASQGNQRVRCQSFIRT